MKPQQSEPDRQLDIRRCLQLTALVAGLLALLSCENDLEKIRTITSLEEFPDASGQKYEILYSDSMRVRVRILAPEIQRFASPETPTTRFPRGMTAYFYNDSLEIMSVISAKDVVYFENDHLWEAKHNVEARNLENGNQINSEHMFWDERKKEIYSHTNSRIVNEDGTFYGENGFIAKQDLSWYRLIGVKNSTVIVKDE
jgi:hypothetical protein